MTRVHLRTLLTAAGRSLLLGLAGWVLVLMTGPAAQAAEALDQAAMERVVGSATNCNPLRLPPGDLTKYCRHINTGCPGVTAEGCTPVTIRQAIPSNNPPCEGGAGGRWAKLANTNDCADVECCSFANDQPAFAKSNINHTWGTVCSTPNPGPPPQPTSNCADNVPVACADVRLYLDAACTEQVAGAKIYICGCSNYGAPPGGPGPQAVTRPGDGEVVPSP